MPSAVQEETSTSGVSVPIDFQHDGDKIPSPDYVRGMQGVGVRSVPRPEIGYVYFQNIKAYFLNGVPQAPALNIQRVDMSTLEPAGFLWIQKRFVTVTFHTRHCKHSGYHGNELLSVNTLRELT